MRIFRRWTRVLGANFDWMISQVENHEALIESAIREMQDSSKVARAKLCEVQQAGKRIRHKCKELEITKDKWKERTLSFKDAGSEGEDREKALECLKRLKQAEKELVSSETRALEHKKLESQLAEDLKVIEQKISALKQKKLEMSVQEFQAASLANIPVDNLGTFSEIDEIFDRWEIKLARCQAAGSAFSSKVEDSLESEFIEKEEELELNTALDELLRGNG